MSYNRCISGSNISHNGQNISDQYLTKLHDHDRFVVVFCYFKNVKSLDRLIKKIYMMNSTKNGALGHVKRILIWVANKRIFFSSSFGWPRNHAYEGATLPDPTWCCRRLADELSESCCCVVDERSASQPETTWCSRSLAGERHASRHSSTSRRKQGAPGGSAPQAS